MVAQFNTTFELCDVISMIVTSFDIALHNSKVVSKSVDFFGGQTKFFKIFSTDFTIRVMNGHFSRKMF